MVELTIINYILPCSSVLESLTSKYVMIVCGSTVPCSLLACQHQHEHSQHCCHHYMLLILVSIRLRCVNKVIQVFFSVCGSEVVDNRFRIGRWKISSQSLDGQKLETSQWIMPKVTPKVETLPLLKKSPRFLDAFQLENPSQRMQNLQGRHSKPILSNVWLPKTNRANMSPIFDGTKALFIS